MYLTKMLNCAFPNFTEGLDVALAWYLISAHIQSCPMGKAKASEFKE